MTAIIEVKQLTVRFDTHCVLKDLDLLIHPGEILAIVGGSGAGKTTLLRAILMLVPASGSIKVFDQEILRGAPQAQNQARHNWGVMFQQGALFSSLTVLENIAYPLQAYTALDNKTIFDIARLKMALVGLKAEAAYRYPAELSGGMIKRAALARAIAMDPKLLFLDEPTAGLDPQGASALDELILSLRENLGLTVIMVTHDLDTLWHTTDRVAFLAEGKVLAAEPMDKLSRFDHPMIQDYFNNNRAKVARKIFFN